MKIHLLLLTAALLVQGSVSAAENVEKIFTEIYDTGYWGRNSEGKGYSGLGSTVENAAPYMQFLENFMRANDIRSVVDIGCGDWTFSQHIKWGEVTYVGFDVVKSVIEANQMKFSTDKIKFFHADIVQAALPAADLLLCKDVLMHLTNQDVALFLQQIGKYRHCLITNNVDRYTWSSDNREIETGKFRPVDLTKPPFNLKGVKILTYPCPGHVKQILYIQNDG